MKLVTYRSKKVSEARIGVISNGQIVDIFQLGLETGFDFPISMLEFIDQGPDSLCLLYTSPSPRDRTRSRMPSSA